MFYKLLRKNLGFRFIMFSVLSFLYDLLQAGEGQMGTDESVFNQILCTRNYNQLRQTFYFYHTDHDGHIIDVIKSECTGSLELAYKTMGKLRTHHACVIYLNILSRQGRLNWALMNQFLTKFCVPEITTNYEKHLDTMRMIMKPIYLTT